MSHTVVIAGGGPTGLMLAGELSLAGINAVVIERSLDPSGQSRALGLHSSTVEVFDQRGFADQFRDMPVFPANHFAFLPLDLSKLDQECTFIVPQWRTELALAEYASNVGADIRRGHEVTGFDEDDAGVRVRVRSDSHEYTVQGEYLIGCDGGSSLVRKLARFEFPGTASTYYGLLGDVEQFDESIHQKVGAGLYPTGMFGQVPLSAAKLRLMTTEFDRPLPSDDTPITLDDLRDSIRRVTGADVEIDKPVWLSRFGNATRQVTQYQQGRVFLAGDAAHIHYPIGGQGLNAGVQDAVNLGWKLAAEINGWAPPSLIDTYHAERHPVGQEICTNTQAQLALLNPMERVGPLREVFSRLMKFDDVNRCLVEMVTGSAVQYPIEYPGQPDAQDPLLGRRVPRAELSTADGPTSVITALRSGHALLLDLSGGSAALPELAPWDGRVDLIVADPTPDIDARVLLVRPDGHVAWADRTGTSTEGLYQALKTWFGGNAQPAGVDRLTVVHGEPARTGAAYEPALDGALTSFQVSDGKVTRR
jgi:2-polyprenyl-6-methoxyphenol hydroxylase-like FAD-dependent oxidoreductase